MKYHLKFLQIHDKSTGKRSSNTLQMLYLSVGFWLIIHLLTFVSDAPYIEWLFLFNVLTLGSYIISIRTLLKTDSKANKYQPFNQQAL